MLARRGQVRRLGEPGQWGGRKEGRDKTAGRRRGGAALCARARARAALRTPKRSCRAWPEAPLSESGANIKHPICYNGRVQLYTAEGLHKLLRLLPKEAIGKGRPTRLRVQLQMLMTRQGAAPAADATCDAQRAAGAAARAHARYLLGQDQGGVRTSAGCKESGSEQHNMARHTHAGFKCTLSKDCTEKHIILP